MSLIVHDVNGRILLEKKLNLEKDNYIVELNLENINSGFYFLNVNTSQNSSSIKFIKN